ncbi:MAG: glycosyltransferase family 2 protein [Campylobacteraceae bacterium]|nr:glycosyltransferase family 2 protein [Campylobacteraceae bacterium]
MQNLTVLSASIVIYNEQEEILKRVIENFLSISLEKELIIVDNSSSNVLQQFCESYKDIVYIFHGQNVGFAKGHNLAFQNANNKSNIHLILNPDIDFKPLELEKFLRWFYESKNIALALPAVKNFDESEQKVARNIPTIISLIKRRYDTDYDTIKIAKDSIVEIPFAHGCVMAFKIDVFRELDGFDERFFMYMEDVDIWIRAKKHGKTVINTNYSIYHEYRKASSKNLKLFWYHIISVLKYFWKYK